MSKQNEDGNGDNTGGGPVGGFKQRLYQLRRAAGLSQSGLARKVWGELEDARGYMVARNRDRVSAYEAGRAEPTRENLDGLAEALGVTVAELAPDLVLARPNTLGVPAPAVSFALTSGGMARLKVDMEVPLGMAVAVLKMLAPENRVGR